MSSFNIIIFTLSYIVANNSMKFLCKHKPTNITPMTIKKIIKNIISSIILILIIKFNLIKILIKCMIYLSILALIIKFFI
jgi:hypothetical protein